MVVAVLAVYCVVALWAGEALGEPHNVLTREGREIIHSPLQQQQVIEGKECIDQNRHCQYWASIGECTNQPVFMNLYCKKSCGLCDPLKHSNNSSEIHKDNNTDSITETNDLGIGGEATGDARPYASFPNFKGKPTACIHRGKNVRGICLQLQECYPYFRLAGSEAWRYGIYDSCNDLREGVEEPGVCCIQEEPAVNNEVEPQRYNYADEIILDESMVPGLMNRGHVEFRPLNLNLTRRPTQKWDPRYPLFPAHPTHPPLPTHPPSITNQPWWNPTTKNPVGSVGVTLPPWVPSVTTSRPTTSAWWVQPTTKPTTTRPPTTVAAVNPTTVASSFGNANPCAAHSFYIAGENEAQALWEQFNNISSDGLGPGRVVGGFPSRPHSHPWLATLFNGAKQFCGGSLIDKTHILTAAHCIAHMSSADVSRLRVRLGAHNIHAKESTTQEFKVTKVVRHKDYDARKLYNDVAMLTLDKEAQFNNNVRPICLASGGNWVDDIATVAGWGSLYEGGPQPGALQEVKLRVWSLQRCDEYYGRAAPGGIIESYICAGDGGKDSCMGDSGGPLVKQINGVWTQIGIVSWGIGCGKGSYPGVYSRLPSFLGWINRVKAIYR